MAKLNTRNMTISHVSVYDVCGNTNHHSKEKIAHDVSGENTAIAQRSE